MEALRTEPVAEGETAVSSVQVVSQVLSQNSSNLFLKSVGIKPVPSSKSSSSNESELREQLAAEATAVVQGEIDELRKRSEEAEEKLARTQKEMEEYKKLTEINNKAMEENNALLKRILAINNASSTWALLVAAGSLSKGSAGDFVYVVTYVAGGWQLFIISCDVNVNWDETSSSNVMSSELCEPSLELLIKLLVIGILDLLIYGSFWSFQYYLHSVMKSACALVMNYLTFLWWFGN